MAKIVNTQRPIKAAATRDSNTIRGHRTDTDSRLGGHWENGKPDFENFFENAEITFEKNSNSRLQFGIFKPH